ncbi:MAG: polysaccharide biosynthesis tyrosine autokinase [Gallionellaceae bacterium]|nr:polysaccharide biosynthesis tyrosine autokinase [Gallionellaceae bacterium]
MHHVARAAGQPLAVGDQAFHAVALREARGEGHGVRGLAEEVGPLAFALARQYDYPYLLKGDGEVSNDLIAAFLPFSPQVEALRALRSQLMLRWFTGDPERKALAIASPGRGEGRSWLAANLAIVFSQLGENTLLIDADMRNPVQHSLFKLENRSGLSSLLSGRGDTADVKRIQSFIGLSVLPAGPVPPNPQELLGRSQFAALLGKLRGEFDIIIIDTAAGADYADAQTVAVRAGGALLLAHKHETSLHALGAFTESLRQLGVQPVGSVISEF